MLSPTDIRLALRRNGFCPLPLVGKVPVIKGWQNLRDVDDDVIEQWPRFHPNAENTGIRCEGVPVLDVDIMQMSAASMLETIVRERYQPLGQFLVRVGRPPKRCFLFRCDEPFAKITCKLIAPDGSTQRLEFLGDVQQVAAFGEHPDTHAPYSWRFGDPLQVTRDQLPPIVYAEAQQLMHHLAGLLVERFGFQHGKEREPDAVPVRPASPRPNGEGNSYARAALQRELAILANTREGGRNDQLNICSVKLYEFVGAGLLEEREVVDGMLLACDNNGLTADDGISSVRKTILSGRRKGLANPRIIPKRERKGGSSYARPAPTSTRPTLPEDDPALRLDRPERAQRAAAAARKIADKYIPEPAPEHHGRQEARTPRG